MKKSLSIFVLTLLLCATSCQTLVVTKRKPLIDNSLELYQKYTIQTQDAKTIKMEVLKIDDTKIYGKNSKGESIEIERANVREVKKPDILSSFGIAIIAIAAVVFVPI